MATVDSITAIAHRLLKKYDTRDPSKICQELGIMLRLRDLGDTLNAYYFVHSRMRVITVNNRLNSEAIKLYIAHELGHDQIPQHRQVARLHGFRSFDGLDLSSPYEFQANIFLAEFMISDSDLWELLKSEHSYQEIAELLQVPRELLDVKYWLLKRQGFSLEPVNTVRGDFFRKGIPGVATSHERP